MGRLVYGGTVDIDGGSRIAKRGVEETPGGGWGGGRRILAMMMMMEWMKEQA